jgi:hypothetical protein
VIERTHDKCPSAMHASCMIMHQLSFHRMSYVTYVSRASAKKLQTDRQNEVVASRRLYRLDPTQCPCRPRVQDDRRPRGIRYLEYLYPKDHPVYIPLLAYFISIILFTSSYSSTNYTTTSPHVPYRYPDRPQSKDLAPLPDHSARADHTVGPRFRGDRLESGDTSPMGVVDG